VLNPEIVALSPTFKSERLNPIIEKQKYEELKNKPYPKRGILRQKKPFLAI
jgi:hypothetical protein